MQQLLFKTLCQGFNFKMITSTSFLENNFLATFRTGHGLLMWSWGLPGNHEHHVGDPWSNGWDVNSSEILYTPKD